MLKGFGKGNSAANHAAHLAYGHHKFMERNRGRTDDARKQHYAVNPEFVLSNNRHFIAESQMEAQPNGDGTTEGQSVQILGYAYMFEATGHPVYLERAEQFFEAYVKHFYQEDVPDTPRRWVCNWIVNSKEPVLANWPVDFAAPTHSGFKEIELDWVNGKTQIPHGAPYWGEYVDKVTFGFRGNLGWDSIVATVYAQNPDGSTNWNKLGEEYEIEYVINYECKKFDSNGDPESHDKWGDDPIFYPPERRGEVQLKRRDINGKARLNWGNAQPVEHGGYLIGRNEAWHNRPLRVPVGKENFGNAADGEEWFLDACWKLWELTGKERYMKAFRACEYTLNEYMKIDQEDRYFRKSSWGQSPFTDGISYWYSYPSEVEPKFSRDSAGYITVRAEAGSQQTIEQNSVWDEVNEQSTITTTVGGKDDKGGPLAATIVVGVGPERNDKNLSDWQITLPNVSDIPVPFTVGMGSLTKEKNPWNGKAYIVADSRAVVGWNAEEHEAVFEDNVYDTRSATVIRSKLSGGTSGMMIGFWLTPEKSAVLERITYQADRDFYIQVYDLKGYRWHCLVPGTRGKWAQYLFGKYKFTPTEYQPNFPDIELLPTDMAWGAVSDLTVVQAGDEQLNFAYYCVNDVPVRFTGKGFTIKYGLTVKGENAFTATVGDCMARNTLGNKLYCTPGVVPFSNIYLPDQETFDGWHGMPYPGYQYPFIFVHNTHPDRDLMLKNMSKFLWESQDWYARKFGLSGPGASAYIWNRWDNLKYGTPDTWTMYHWGDGHAWDGYQPRAFFGAARACWELKKYGMEIPPQLLDYARKWGVFLSDFMKKYKVNPTLFTADGKVPGITDDFTGHMSGLWLGGACFLASVTKDNPIPGLDDYIRKTFKEINDEFHIIDGKPEHVMNGSWSPAVRENTGDGVESNGMFFGFWSGEILRGLGIFILYNNGRL
ncbi:glycosidase superfamilly protein [Aeromonas phage Atoyac14]|uniref:Glycosidase superfamilly protein n=1 Tax=Aeromonas phage Atoyac1 TaxID=2767547 RepID=A0A866D114_9CAUD|nr:glycosidase superfamilly protein [Aeromonas phage Atoyac1]QOC54328.1 glycosidase superfamilly protein [Aeromonas phage Atoyac14]